MGETIVLSALIVLAAIGLTDVALFLKRRILGRVENCYLTAIVPVGKGDAGAEMTVRAAKSLVSHGVLPGKSMVLVLDRGADEETLRVCRELCTEDCIVPAAERPDRNLARALSGLLDRQDGEN